MNDGAGEHVAGRQVLALRAEVVNFLAVLAGDLDGRSLEAGQRRGDATDARAKSRRQVGLAIWAEGDAEG